MSGGPDIPTLPVGHLAAGGGDAGCPGQPSVAGRAAQQPGPGPGHHVPGQVSLNNQLCHVSCVMFHVSPVSRWLLFRMMFASGVVKVRSKKTSWNIFDSNHLIIK